jgi:hypothetical protein
MFSAADVIVVNLTYCSVAFVFVAMFDGVDEGAQSQFADVAIAGWILADDCTRSPAVEDDAHHADQSTHPDTKRVGVVVGVVLSDVVVVLHDVAQYSDLFWSPHFVFVVEVDRQHSDVGTAGVVVVDDATTYLIKAEMQEWEGGCK